MPAPRVCPFAYPLDEFYARAGAPLPRIEQIPGNRIPEPYRRLLVHLHDMTPTLEAFHGSDIHIEVLHRERRGDFYFREVVLRLDRDQQPVEFGANRVCLAWLAPKVRALILEEHLPLAGFSTSSKCRTAVFPNASCGSRPTPSSAAALA